MGKLFCLGEPPQQRKIPVLQLTTATKEFSYRRVESTQKRKNTLFWNQNTNFQWKEFVPHDVDESREKNVFWLFETSLTKNWCTQNFCKSSIRVKTNISENIFESIFKIKNQLLCTQHFLIWNPNLAVHQHLWKFITYTNFIHTPIVSLQQQQEVY